MRDSTRGIVRIVHPNQFDYRGETRPSIMKRVFDSLNLEREHAVILNHHIGNFGIIEQEHSAKSVQIAD
jgi:hypothetical protein